jgi:ParB-like nuclease domain
MNQLLSQPIDVQFSLATALMHRDQGTFDQWLDKFLRGPGRNVPLADGLLLEKRWWIGPEEIPLSNLVLKCGPGLEFHEDEVVWKARIEKLAEKIQNGLIVPPLIAEFQKGTLFLADGNHRCGALQLNGASKYWTAIWFNSESEWATFMKNR